MLSCVGALGDHASLSRGEWAKTCLSFFAEHFLYNVKNAPCGKEIKTFRPKCGYPSCSSGRVGEGWCYAGLQLIGGTRTGL